MGVETTGIHILHELAPIVRGKILAKFPFVGKEDVTTNVSPNGTCIHFSSLVTDKTYKNCV